MCRQYFVGLFKDVKSSSFHARSLLYSPDLDTFRFQFNRLILFLLSKKLKLKPRLFVSAVLKLLKMAKSVRALLDTVVQALPEVGNLGLLFFLLFFIFAALGVELFGRVGEANYHYCVCLGEVQVPQRNYFT
jgi:hypothetical protein